MGYLDTWWQRYHGGGQRTSRRMIGRLAKAHAWLAATLLLSGVAHAGLLDGRIVAVHDGDTLAVAARCRRLARSNKGVVFTT